MDIGIVGGGHIGATAAKLFVRAGHQPGMPVYDTDLTPQQAATVLAQE